jgi:hypothetical protein
LVSELNHQMDQPGTGTIRTLYSRGVDFFGCTHAEPHVDAHYPLWMGLYLLACEPRRLFVEDTSLLIAGGDMVILDAQAKHWLPPMDPASRMIWTYVNFETRPTHEQVEEAVAEKIARWGAQSSSQPLNR